MKDNVRGVGVGCPVDRQRLRRTTVICAMRPKQTLETTDTSGRYGRVGKCSGKTISTAVVPSQV